MKTTTNSQCALNILAIDTPMEYARLTLGNEMQAWDAISRYIYTGLQDGSIMKGWMKKENEMISCCSDGTRPVIFKIERIDYEEKE